MTGSKRRRRALVALLGAGVAVSASAGGALAAGPADDRIGGTIRSETIAGLGGDDRLAGREGNDRLRGGEGDDLLIGGRGQDHLDGGPGDDSLSGGPDVDLFDAGEGDDLVLAADGLPEVVACGPGVDRALVDTHDRVDESCEAVSRRAPDPAHLLWANTLPLHSAIARSTTEGRAVQPFFIVTPEKARSGRTFARTVTDTALGGPWLFTANREQGRIVRTDRDGRNQIDKLVNGLGADRVVGTTSAGDHVFWTDARGRKIGRAGRDGSDRQKSFIRNLRYRPIAIASDGAYLYWTTEGATIARARIDGSEVDERFIAPSGIIFPDRPFGIDVLGGHIYWTVPVRGWIGRAGTDGGDVRRDFLDLPRRFPFELTTPIGVAVDAKSIYWTDVLGARIGKADIDGGTVEPRLVRRGVAIPALIDVERIPRAAIDPGMRDFGARELGTGPSAPAGFEVESDGNADLAIGTVRLTGPGADQFAISSQNCAGATLVPGADCDVEVVFQPTRVGGAVAFVEVVTDDPDAPLLLGLVRGEGVAPDAAIAPASADYGPQEVRGAPSAPRTFTVTSTGSAPLVLGSAGLVGDDAGDFRTSDDACSGQTIPPQGTCTVKVAFAPASGGWKAAALRIPGAGTSPTLEAALSGQGVSAAAALVPGLVRFAERQEGSGPSDPQTVRLESVGDAPLDVTRVKIGGTDPGDFRLVGDECSGRTLAPGAGCDIGVAFDPGAAGAKGAKLEVVADDPGLDDPAATADLAGTASAKPVPPQPPPQPVPTPIPSGTAQADCGPSEVTGVAVAGAGSRVVNGVRQPFSTRPYDGDMVVSGTTSCASGMRVSLWGPELRRRSADFVSAGADGPVSATAGLRVHARATVQADGSFRLPADTRAPGQYFVALDGTIPQAGAPLWLRIDPVLKANRRGSRVIVFAGPPVGTAGAAAVLERRAGGSWKRVSAGRVSRRARVSLAGGRTTGALRVRLVASKSQDSLQPDLIVQARTTVR